MEKVQGNIKELGEHFASLAYYNNELNKKLVSGKNESMTKIFVVINNTMNNWHD